VKVEILVIRVVHLLIEQPRDLFVDIDHVMYYVDKNKNKTGVLASEA